MPKHLESLAVTHFSNLKQALEWCDVANILRIQLERQDVNYFPSLREYAMLYGIDKAVLSNLNKEITIMHPGPINRGVEISSDVADSKHAIILDQVENGVAIRMAVLFLLAGKINDR
jgi:aspartate carbamoyltransferase catalytic subunit